MQRIDLSMVASATTAYGVVRSLFMVESRSREVRKNSAICLRIKSARRPIYPVIPRLRSSCGDRHTPCHPALQTRQNLCSGYIQASVGRLTWAWVCELNVGVAADLVWENR